MEFSLRNAILNNFPDYNFRNGLWHPFYHSPEGRKTLPYRTLRQMCTALQWPAGFTYESIEPNEATNEWTEEAQGVTTDGSNWYFSSAYKLIAIAGSADVAQEANILKVFNLGTSHEEDDMPDYPEGFPEVLKGYRHFGSLDHYQGYLYVPLSEKLGYKKKNPAYPDCIITVFNCQDLSLVAAAPLLYNQWVNGALQPVSDRSNAWCAINPLNGYLYVARFYETREPDEGFTLRVYKQELTGNQLHLEFVGEMPLYGKEGQPIFLKRVQGGTFSKNGHLYLVSDSHLVDNLLSGHFINGPSGVYAFDMVTGRNTFYIPIAPERNLWASEELESVALFTGSKYSGHVHILVLDNDMDEIGTDDISLIHFSVTPEDVDKL